MMKLLAELIRPHDFPVLFLLVLTPFEQGTLHGQTFGASSHDRSQAVALITFSVDHRTLSPSSVTVKPGRYLVRLRNGLTYKDLSLNIEAPAKAKSGKVNVLNGKGKGGSYFDLEIGAYEVSVEGYAQFRAQIVVVQ